MKNFQWINIFIRDLLLTIVVAYVNWKMNYQLWIGGFLTGAMLVLISWHFSDFYNSRRYLQSPS